MPQTTVLLGAGASVDAGLPIATDLTKQIAEAISSDGAVLASGVSHALNRTIGSIIAHQASNGRSAYAGVDAETVFSAVKMLSERETLEISPFVNSWNDATSSQKKTLPWHWPTEFKNALLSPHENDLEKVFRGGVEALTTADPEVYAQVMRSMLWKLQNILQPTSEDRFDYLNAMFTLPQPISIATLNYDQGVEIAAARFGHDLDRGINSWDGGFDWTWAKDGAARLLKLHGLLDWTLKRLPRVAGDPPFAKAAPVIQVETATPTFHPSGPAIVFGARDKLKAEGPFLAMLFEFARWMKETEHLIVVGYSFRDAHINIILRDWLQTDKDKRLTIVDPTFPGDMGRGYIDDFQHFLARGIYDVRSEQVPGTMEIKTFTEVRPGFTILREGAATGLLKACSPTLDLD